MDTPALVQLGIGNISNEVRGALASARFELSGRRGGRGSHRNEPLYRIAEAFGVLYATVTGKTPPVSISESGPRSYSGEFSPALREVCDLLGFEGDIQRANTHAHQAVNNPIKLQSEFEALEGIRSVFERLANDDP